MKGAYRPDVGELPDNEENTPTTQVPSEPAVARRSGLVKRYNDFTWWEDAAGWTTIGDHDCNKIARWMRTLEEFEIVNWCDGYEQGHIHGIEKGKTIKAHEVKRALGLDK